MALPLVGIDSGGTFTDLVLIADGRLTLHKVLSTPDQPARAILQGLADLGVRDVPLAALVHGSTVATNAVLERRGVPTGLITTQGFRDVLEIGRQTRPKLYDLQVRRTPPLVPRARRVEVVERLDARGAVLTPLDSASVNAALAALQADGEGALPGVESVAVVLLFGFANPAHEAQVAAAARAAGFYVSVGHEILPEFREYERTSTVVLNAYVGPLIDRYLGELEASLPPATPLRIMQSNGGSITSATARREAARTLLSGPAAGVVGAAFVARQAGFDQIITLDIGGTSPDVALVAGKIHQTTDGSIGGLPMRLPMIDIHTVGAGGGSLAWFDQGGALRVGPRSAGADPGPAAYGRGGTGATVTDAQVVLGRLQPDAFLGGAMTLDRAAAERALAEVATRLAMPSAAAALGIVRVINAQMEAAIRVISVERGLDPRDFTLVAFGGAGPLHACELAAALGIPRVLVPASPGVLSALGMLIADILKDYVRTVMVPANDAACPIVDAALADLAAQGRRDLAAEGVTAESLTITYDLDMRYLGQSYELPIPYAGDIAATIADFHAAHARRFGYSDPGEPAQVVNVRLTARGRTEPPDLVAPVPVAGLVTAPPMMRPVIFADEAGEPVLATTAILDRAALSPGARIQGPAIITQYDTTTVLPPGWVARTDPRGQLLAMSMEADQ